MRAPAIVLFCFFVLADSVRGQWFAAMAAEMGKERCHLKRHLLAGRKQSNRLCLDQFQMIIPGVHLDSPSCAIPATLSRPVHRPGVAGSGWEAHSPAAPARAETARHSPACRCKENS